jgi:hypothetical protein
MKEHTMTDTPDTTPSWARRILERLDAADGADALADAMDAGGFATFGDFVRARREPDTADPRSTP